MKKLRSSIVLILGISLGTAPSFATPLEEEYIMNAGWCPGVPGANIQAEHMGWHMIEMAPGFGATAGKEFVEYHREFLAQSDDFRIYGSDVAAGVDPDAAVVSVVAQNGSPLSILKFGHTSLNGYVRAPLADITVPACASSWSPRPAILRFGNPGFYNVLMTANDVGTALNSTFHGGGHMSVANHDRVNCGNPFATGDMGNTTTATRDGAFYQWHKNVDNIYADWAVGQYRLRGQTGVPIFYSVIASAVGAAGSSLNERRQSNVYQGNNPAGANQYGAIPRIASDIYVADNDSSNLTYQAGVRQWNTLNGWDVDAWTILNPAPSGWYFSVTPASVGAAGTAVNAQAVRGGDVFESGGGGANALYRTEAALGLIGAASDNLDALEVDQQKRVQATNDNDRPGIAHRPRQWFSLRLNSTFAVQLMGGAAVNHNMILQFNANGDLVLAATIPGLVAADELDALVIVDTAPLDMLNGTDRIYYSLLAGSPSLGANSAADIFCHTVAGATCGALGGRLEMTAAMLGLLATDDLDALDVRTNPTGTGACCQTNGTCTQTTQAACAGAGGLFWGPETVCSAAECPSAPGACCHPKAPCDQLSDIACLTTGGTFRGVGVTCAAADCQPAPPNDQCPNAYEIPYDYPSQYGDNGYYEPPAEYTDNTYATSIEYGSPYYDPPSGDYYDPPYGCSDHETFFPPYGSGTIWYYYDVPPPGAKSTGETPNVPIPDASPPQCGNFTTQLVRTLNVPESGTISDLNLTLNLQHTFYGDLNITISHGPITVTMLGFATPDDSSDLAGVYVIDDEAAQPLDAAAAAAAAVIPPGPYRGENLLSAFDGQNKQGLWTLTINDTCSGDQGILFAWSLDFINSSGGGRGGSDYYRPIALTTDYSLQSYGQGGDTYAGDTRIAMYYAPMGDCSMLQEVSCGDNSYYKGEYGYDPPYGGYGYTEYYPTQPGRYYVQLSSVGDVNRGRVALRVFNPNRVPAITPQGWAVLVVMTIAGGAFAFRRRAHTRKLRTS